MKPDLSDAELDELAALLDAAPAPLEPLDVPALDGYLAGTLVQARVLARDEWLPPIFTGHLGPLPADLDAAWLARCTALIERRRDALNAAISEDGWFDPVMVDVDDLPPASEYDKVQTPIARALLPWAAGFGFAQGCFPQLEQSADEAVDAALDRIYRYLPVDDDEPPKEPASLDAGIEDLVHATVELWDLTAKARFAVAPIRRDAPKVGRNDPCPCGSGKKFKACHGKA